LIGILVGLFVGAVIHLLTSVTKQQTILCFTMAAITGWLATGLFTGGMHEFEEVLGETPDVFHMPGCKSSKSDTCSFFHHKKFPCALIKPFGYSHSPSMLQVSSFWCFFLLLVSLHVCMWKRAEKRAAAVAEMGDPMTTKSIVVTVVRGKN
jgi:high-affinity iron transporter